MSLLSLKNRGFQYEPFKSDSDCFYIYLRKVGKSLMFPPCNCLYHSYMLVYLKGEQRAVLWGKY